jgi:hypothetical protein
LIAEAIPQNKITASAPSIVPIVYPERGRGRHAPLAHGAF